MHGIERPIAYACNYLPALGEVGKAVGERSMQIQTEEMRMSMDGGKGVVPRRPGLMDVWIRILDAVVLVLTFGRGRVVRGPLHGRIRWDGNLK